MAVSGGGRGRLDELGRVKRGHRSNAAARKKALFLPSLFRFRFFAVFGGGMEKEAFLVLVTLSTLQHCLSSRLYHKMSLESLPITGANYEMPPTQFAGVV